MHSVKVTFGRRLGREVHVTCIHRTTSLTELICGHTWAVQVTRDRVRVWGQLGENGERGKKGILAIVARCNTSDATVTRVSE